MRELDHQEGWAQENWCFWTVVLEKTLESPLDCKEIKPVHPKWNQSWIFIGRTDAETPILWPGGQRIDTFELRCWGRLLKVPWTARRSNQSILNEISPEYSLEGLMLKLKLQYFGLLMGRTDSLEKTLMLGKIEGGRGGWQRMRWLDGITNLMDMSLSKLRSWWWTGKPGVLQSMGSQRVGHDWATELNWT